MTGAANLGREKNHFFFQLKQIKQINNLPFIYIDKISEIQRSVFSLHLLL